jgi:hypothetical protein
MNEGVKIDINSGKANHHPLSPKGGTWIEYIFNPDTFFFKQSWKIYKSV